MNPQEIRKIAIDSAEDYLKYLTKNNKGIQEIGISAIEYIENVNIFIKLNLLGKIFDVESLLFNNLRVGKQYDDSQIKIVEYDNDKNILLIKISNNIKEDFKNLNKDDLKLFSDLKFLVARVRDWYKLNGTNIKLYRQKSNIEKIRVDFFSKEYLVPSENQMQSINNILSQPFSYVWGAPGTGKTQIVLAYAVLNYITRNKKVAILAPTNNAIEQVLRGVIKMTDKACIDRKNILRLGMPTRKFAQEFPEVCEEQGLRNKMKEIDKQISILTKVLGYKKSIDNVKYLEELDLYITAYKENKNICSYQTNRQKEIIININMLNKHIERLVQDREKYIEKISGLINKISNYFFHSTKLEDLLKDTENDLRKVEKEVEELKYELTAINMEIKQLKNKVNEIDLNVKRQIKILRDAYFFNNEFIKIIDNINIDNWFLNRQKIEAIYVKLKEQFSIDVLTTKEYNDYLIDEIEYKLKECSQNREKIAIHLSEERIKTSKIIACTLDCYIGKYKETKFDIDHIFLDEAGYANIIKALTLFNNDVPISFLGDHKQLSPVCEMESKNNIQANILWGQSAIFIDYIFSKSQMDFEKSDFSSFMPSCLSKTALNSTFRFGNNLAKILDKYIYKCKIKSASDNAFTKIYFVNAAKKIDGYKLRKSDSEIEAIKNIVKYLKQINQDFMILTPYKKQRNELGKKLPKEMRDWKILTVHGAQGQESDNVIFSVVDTKNDRWFTDSQNPEGLKVINTAISRAKKALIIVCDKNSWINLENQLITDLLKIAEEFSC